jgi:hypothetical protein
MRLFCYDFLFLSVDFRRARKSASPCLTRQNPQRIAAEDSLADFRANALIADSENRVT